MRGLHYLGEVHRPSTLLSLFDKVTRGDLKWQKMPDIYDKIAVGEGVLKCCAADREHLACRRY